MSQGIELELHQLPILYMGDKKCMRDDDNFYDDYDQSLVQLSYNNVKLELSVDHGARFDPDNLTDGIWRNEWTKPKGSTLGNSIIEVRSLPIIEQRVTSQQRKDMLLLTQFTVIFCYLGFIGSYIESCDVGEVSSSGPQMKFCDAKGRPISKLKEEYKINKVFNYRDKLLKTRRTIKEWYSELKDNWELWSEKLIKALKDDWYLQRMFQDHDTKGIKNPDDKINDARRTGNYILTMLENNKRSSNFKHFLQTIKVKDKDKDTDYFWGQYVFEPEFAKPSTIPFSIQSNGSIPLKRITDPKLWPYLTGLFGTQSFGFYLWTQLSLRVNELIDSLRVNMEKPDYDSDLGWMFQSQTISRARTKLLKVKGFVMIIAWECACLLWNKSRLFSEAKKYPINESLQARTSKYLLIGTSKNLFTMLPKTSALAVFHNSLSLSDKKVIHDEYEKILSGLCEILNVKDNWKVFNDSKLIPNKLHNTYDRYIKETEKNLDTDTYSLREVFNSAINIDKTVSNVNKSEIRQQWERGVLKNDIGSEEIFPVAKSISPVKYNGTEGFKLDLTYSNVVGNPIKRGEGRSIDVVFEARHVGYRQVKNPKELMKFLKELTNCWNNLQIDVRDEKGFLQNYNDPTSNAKHLYLPMDFNKDSKTKARKILLYEWNQTTPPCKSLIVREKNSLLTWQEMAKSYHGLVIKPNLKDYKARELTSKEQCVGFQVDPDADGFMQFSLKKFVYPGVN